MFVATVPLVKLALTFIIHIFPNTSCGPHLTSKITHWLHSLLLLEFAATFIFLGFISLRMGSSIVCHWCCTEIFYNNYGAELSYVFNRTETEYVSQMLTMVKRFAQHHSCHVWFVAHPRQVSGQDTNDLLVSCFPYCHSVSMIIAFITAAQLGWECS